MGLAIDMDDRNLFAILFNELYIPIDKNLGDGEICLALQTFKSLVGDLAEMAA